ncbi:MAG TPA: ABC transporter ATP-binding protein [Chloroflexota bacterium]|nr:ABC transporter ATP-binding protein [Chloroflexota bacterium]
MHDDHPPAVELRDVTKIYGRDICALDRADFRVSPGERCCLLGPNGAGKTTIMRLLEGALSPTHGQVKLFGASAGGTSLEAKRRTGVVPQSPGLYPDLTVGEYFHLVHALYGRGDVAAVAHVYGLADYLDRPLSALSGGYQRRLLIAAAVLCEPELLLLDEPTVGLDPLAATEIRRLLVHAMAGKAVLMSTHNLAEAEELCETVIILRQGRVLIHERIDDLRRQAVPRVHLSARQGCRALRAALQEHGVHSSVDETGVWLTSPEPEEQIPPILRTLLDDGLDVYEVRVVPATLEDLFVAVVTR